MGFNWENVTSLPPCNIGINIYEYCMTYKMFESVVGSGQCFDTYTCNFERLILYHIVSVILRHIVHTCLQIHSLLQLAVYRQC